MPARVVVVHDDPDFGMSVAVALKVAGYDAAMFSDPMIALDALDAASRIEMLITRIVFPPGKPNGVALARMARAKRRSIRVLFTAGAEFAWLMDGLGEFLAAPVEVADVVQAVRHALPLHPENPA
jgi:DNA-binding NtrC family response regulator